MKKKLFWAVVAAVLTLALTACGGASYPAYVNYEVYVINADGNGLKKLTDHPADDWPPVWSPDGKQIAFTTSRDGFTEIYVMNADGSGLTRLTNHPAHDNSPAWSPDGRQIAFMSYRDGDPYGEIYLMNADGSDLKNLTNNPANDDGPVWSPDGKQIAFSSGLPRPVD